MKETKALRIIRLDDDWDDYLHHTGKYADKPEAEKSEKSTPEGPETAKPQDGVDPKDGSKDAKTLREAVCDVKKLEPPVIYLDDDWLHGKTKKSKRTVAPPKPQEREARGTAARTARSKPKAQRRTGIRKNKKTQEPR